MPGPTTIALTQGDIDEGNPADSESCPIALAWPRFFPGAEDVCVDFSGVTWVQGGTNYRASLPPAAGEFMQAFDGWPSLHPERTGPCPVAPVAFEVTPYVDPFADDDDDDFDDETDFEDDDDFDMDDDYNFEDDHE